MKRDLVAANACRIAEGVYFGDVPASGLGFFGGGGYEAKWRSGWALQLGLGIQGRRPVEGSRGVAMTTTTQPATLGWNTQLGIRYSFP
jgi:hypothetical protein